MNITDTYHHKRPHPLHRSNY